MASHSEDALNQLQQRLDRLESLLQALIQRTYSLEKRVFPPPDASVAQPHAPSAESASSQTEGTPFRDTKAEAAAASLPSSIPNVRGETATSIQAESLESTIGGNVLNKIGMVAILLGMSYFLKYAIDNRWIGEIGRILIGILVGLGFLGCGVIAHRRKYPVYAITLWGGGIAILYFSIFAAFNFYHLLPQLPALFLMVLITSLAVAMAVNYDSITVAIFATVGGFFTPVLLSTGNDNQVGLFCYILLLDLGVLSLAFFKKWQVLGELSYGLTQLVLLAWASGFYDPSKLWMTELFLTLFFLVFAVLSVLGRLAHPSKSTKRDLILVAANGLFYFLWTDSLFRHLESQQMGLFTAGLALFYFGSGFLLSRRYSHDASLLFVQLGLSVTFLTLAIPLQLSANNVSLGWATEAIFLCWVGFSRNSRFTRWTALIVSGLFTLHLLIYDAPLNKGLERDTPFLWNRTALTFLFCALVLFAMARFYSSHSQTLDPREKGLMATLILLANGLILFFLTMEISRYFKGEAEDVLGSHERRRVFSRMQLAISALWGVYSILLVSIGILARFRSIRVMAIVLFALTILKVFLSDLQQMEKLYRIVASIGLGLLLLGVSMMYQKYRARINEIVLRS
ncbi:MAG: DUF2339 domain-containing protein [Terriglobia bacterium]